LQSARSSAKNDFFDAQTRAQKERLASARRGSVTAPATASGFRGVITFTTQDPMVRHGWLTPAAPGARRQSPEK
jgi:hypothetical protein